MRSLFAVCVLAISMLSSAEVTPSYTVKNFSYLRGMDGFNDNLLDIHFKLYEGYVKNTNELLAKLSSMQTGSQEYGALKRRLGWEFDGMRLHELYFHNLGGKGTLSKECPLYNAITAQFGGFERWKKDFIATGSIRGIGWAALYVDTQTKKLINIWINEHDMGQLAMGSPILVMDVFEHAYMPEYGLDKAGYIAAFFNNINWPVACERYCKATNPNCPLVNTPEDFETPMSQKEKDAMANGK